MISINLFHVCKLSGEESKTTPAVQDVHAVLEIREELLVVNSRPQTD